MAPGHGSVVMRTDGQWWRDDWCKMAVAVIDCVPVAQTTCWRFVRAWRRVENRFSSSVLLAPRERKMKNQGGSLTEGPLFQFLKLNLGVLLKRSVFLLSIFSLGNLKINFRDYMLEHHQQITYNLSPKICFLFF